MLHFIDLFFYNFQIDIYARSRWRGRNNWKGYLILPKIIFSLSINKDAETLAISRRKMPIMLGTTRDESSLKICQRLFFKDCYGLCPLNDCFSAFEWETDKFNNIRYPNSRATCRRPNRFGFTLLKLQILHIKVIANHRNWENEIQLWKFLFVLFKDLIQLLQIDNLFR